MENNYLKYVITEGIYLINEPQAPSLEKPTEKEKEVKEEKPTDSIPEKPDLNIKGDANSQIMILVFEETSEFLSASQEEFLKNILSAVKLNLNEVALINLAKSATTITEIDEKLDKGTIMAFGLPASLTLPGDKKYEIQSTGSSQILLADSLQNIEADKSLKKALWTNLQQLFLK